MGNDSRTSPTIVADPGGVNGLIGIYPAPHDDHPLSKSLSGTAKARSRRGPSARPAPHHVQAQSHDSLLPRGKFAETVHRETRRSERTGSPLSIVRYTIDTSKVDDPLHLEHVIEVIQASMRETDFLGHMGIDTLALLCPDTDTAGAHGLIAKLEPLLADLHVQPVTATFPEHLFENIANNTSNSGAYQLLTAQAAPSESTGTYPVKRALDIVLALVALLLLGPLMLVVAVIVKLTSRGPVIFRQPRLGKGGEAFTFYKFRSMVVDVDDRIHREYMANLIRAGHGAPGAAGTSPSYKMKADPRVTRIGRLIRRTSIDELPQLFNVLKGDMSMVGPRPPIPYEASHYEPWHLRRILAIKPGITGLWQVEGRSRVSFSEMVRMDLRYIRNCSLKLDITLLLRTVSVVLRGDGAR